MKTLLIALLILITISVKAGLVKTVFINSYEDPKQSLRIDKNTPSNYVSHWANLPTGTKGWIGWKFDIASSHSNLKVKVNLYNSSGQIVSTHHWWGYPVQSSLSFEALPSGSYIEGPLWVSMQCHSFGTPPDSGQCTTFITLYAE